ncbi:CCHC-type domain-containing protein [Nephila pilipes]|uniref:CCHC-type domain-containing protein n=1 Tax=Nephila pilipes TaxID=299642 RepID=A0A8X6U3J6_NEPPI|nr:CCHC-type domain-containing protein [Nephila pilipes]
MKEDGYIEIVSLFGEEEMTSLRMFEMCIDDGVYGSVPVSCAVLKKLASDLLSSIAAYERVRKNVKFHSLQSSSDDDVHKTTKKKADDPFVGIEAQRNRFRPSLVMIIVLKIQKIIEHRLLNH